MFLFIRCNCILSVLFQSSILIWFKKKKRYLKTTTTLTADIADFLPNNNWGLSLFDICATCLRSSLKTQRQFESLSSRDTLSSERLTLTTWQYCLQPAGPFLARRQSELTFSSLHLLYSLRRALTPRREGVFSTQSCPLSCYLVINCSIIRPNPTVHPHCK